MEYTFVSWEPTAFTCSSWMWNKRAVFSDFYYQTVHCITLCHCSVTPHKTIFLSHQIRHESLICAALMHFFSLRHSLHCFFHFLLGILLTSFFVLLETLGFSTNKQSLNFSERNKQAKKVRNYIFAFAYLFHFLAITIICFEYSHYNTTSSQNF